MSQKRSISERGLALIKQFEGCRLDAYQDTGGVWTIGWGSTTNVQPGMSITPEQAEVLLRHDVAKAEACVNDMAPGLTQNQFDACVVFSFNVGCGAFRNSTMLTLIHKGDIEAASRQFGRWIRDDGVVLNGLVKRRAAESDLFLTPDSAP